MNQVRGKKSKELFVKTFIGPKSCFFFTVLFFVFFLVRCTLDFVEKSREDTAYQRINQSIGEVLNYQFSTLVDN